MDRTAAITLLDRLHDAQNRFYSGGDDSPLRALLHPGVIWTVPGDNRIAGTYRGIDAVFAYFTQRRDLAGRTFRMHRRDVLAGEGLHVAALTDGTATIAGATRTWSTLGLYEMTGEERIAACWLLALDPVEFDSIWS